MSNMKGGLGIVIEALNSGIFSSFVGTNEDNIWDRTFEFRGLSPEIQIVCWLQITYITYLSFYSATL